ncbi:MAG: M67 family metallopeptidase [Candidatus Korarchaeum sp.]
MRGSRRRLVIRREVLSDIVEHMDEEIPREACGLLLGISGGDVVFVRASIRARNLSESQLLYEVDPLDTYRALREAESLGLELVGVYHSHCFGEPLPSRIDLERAVPGLIYLIVSGDRRFKAFEMIEGDFKELEVSVEF